MKLTGKKLYKKVGKGEELGLIVFACDDLNQKQKKLYEKAHIFGNTFLVSRVNGGWDMEGRASSEGECLKRIILDNFPNFNFSGKKFWFYQKEDLENSDSYLFVKCPTTVIKNE